MKSFRIAALLFVSAIAGIGVAMAVTNPGEEAYEAYAVAQLSEQLEARICEKAPLFLEGICGSVLSDNQSWLRDLVQGGTVRRNYLFLSIYETNLETEAALDRVLPANLSLSVDGLPAYHVETVGVFRQFYTYEVRQVNRE
ncbi:MAG: DUF4359 domain-containing protein [Synechococcales bacterium]|nr:DUF4359 domain-containing protein [Synechococcales bacterium]